MKKNILLILILSIAFAYIESAVVIYLRSLYFPNGFPFPLQTFNNSHLLIELGREVATIIMLIGLGYLIGKNFLQRFALFMFAFGVWDIFYYIWLKIFINWPESFFSWDILFLIPLPWLGPVLSPIIVSVCLILSSIIILIFEDQEYPLSFNAMEWITVVLMGLIIIYTYLQNSLVSIIQNVAFNYSWTLFFVSLFLGIIIFVRRVILHLSRLRRHFFN